MLRRLLVLAAVLCAGQAGPGFGAQVATAAPATGCAVLNVHAHAGDAGSTVAKVRLPGGTPRMLTRLPYRVDALGYSDSQDLGYGVGVRGAGQAKVVTIDRYGSTRDLGVIASPGTAPIPAVSAGAISGSTWYLGTAGKLYTVDIDPGSRAYLRVQSVRELRPKRLAAVDDFAVDPANGRLYGVAVSSRGDVIAVSIDPASGRVRPEPQVQLPSTKSVGSVVLAPGRTLFASTRFAGRGRWYEVQASGGVRVAGTAPASAHTDAAGCLPPPPEFPRPPASMSPPSAPQEPSQPGTAPPSRAEPSDPVDSPQPETAGQRQSQAQTEEQDATQKKRRWSIAMLVLILGAGAALHRAHR